MVDFSKIFNIVFVSACAALSLLFLISVIVVAAKGKRKCGAWDVILRILGTVVLILSAAMVGCSVLTMTKGSVAIAVSEEPLLAILVMGESLTELPLPDLFVALSTVIGFGLSAVLLMLSLAALTVDCLVANKKDDKKKAAKQKKEPAPKKTPEQLKREAELERIRRIGESAVRKTGKVASAGAGTTDTATQQPKQEEPAAATQEQPKQEEPVADWRETPAEPPKGFVGLKDTQDEFDSFDSFDSFDENAQDGAADEPAEETSDNVDNFDDFTQPEYNAETESDATDADNTESADSADEYAEETDEAVEETDEYVEESDEAVEETDEYVEESDEAVEETDEYVEESDEYAEETETTEDSAAQQEDVYYDDGQFTYSESETEQPAEENYSDEQDIIEDDGGYEQADAEQDGEIAQEQDEPVADESLTEVEPEQESASEQQADGVQADNDIEPDRGIYIPEIRTVTPRAAEKPAAPQKTVAAKKPAAKKPAAKPKKPKKSDGGESQKPIIPPEKKLPVRRRYVIIDRHNAVNMFGEYLKERSQADKDKLKSSINTIIIE